MLGCNRGGGSCAISICLADLCRTHGITEQTYYRWKAKYGGMERSEMQWLKALEDENRQVNGKIQRAAPH